jgi:hypothetical protein
LRPLSLLGYCGNDHGRQGYFLRCRRTEIWQIE